MKVPIKILCRPISSERPSGDDLEYSLEYFRLHEMLSLDFREYRKREGIENTEPDWKEAEESITLVQAATRDLRIQVYASFASLHNGNIFDFRDNLKVLICYLRDFWDSVHPELDPEDDNDPILRHHRLMQLNEDAYIYPAFDQLKLVDVDGFGAVTQPEIKSALRKNGLEKNEADTDLGRVLAAFEAKGGKHVDSTVEAIGECIELLADLGRTWMELTHGSYHLDLEKLVYALENLADNILEVAPEDSVAKPIARTIRPFTPIEEDGLQYREEIRLEEQRKEQELLADQLTVQWESDTSQRVSSLIAAAFEGVVLEDGISLHETALIYYHATDAERAKAREGDEKVDWKRLIGEPDFRNSWCNILSTYDAKGFRFHLPAALTVALDEPNHELIESLIDNLTKKSYHSRNSILNRQQRDCVKEVLLFIRQRPASLYSYKYPGIDDAIADYWGA